MNRLITKVALVAATAMTVSLASPVTAQASDSVDGQRGTTKTGLSQRAATPSAVTAAGSVRFTTSAVIGSSKYVYAKTRASVSAPGATSWYAYADIYVNGVVRERDQIVASLSSPALSASWPRSSGYGKVQLRNVRVIAYDASYNRTDTRIGDSNVAPVRRGTTYKIRTQVQRKGSKVTVRASRWRVYQPNGSTVAVRKLQVKRLKKGKWRNVKTIRLNKKGAGKVSFKSKKKYKYRVYLKTTSTVQGTYMYFPRKV